MLTVVDKGDDWFAVDVRKRPCRALRPTVAQGARLNSNAAARLGDELGGNIVTGHVDAAATWSRRIPRVIRPRIAVEVPSSLAGLIAAKGSITLDACR